MKFWIKMIAGLIMGIIVGTYIDPGSISLEPMRITGVMFFKLLNFAVFPLLFVTSVRNMLYLRSNKRLFLVLLKSLGYFILLTVTGSAIGVVLGGLLQPGVGINIKALESPAVIQYPETTAYILKVVPESVIGFLKPGNAVLAVLFVSFLVAMGLILAKEDGDDFHAVLISIDRTFHRLNRMILEFLPIGIFTYVGYTMGMGTFANIMPYLKLVLTIIAGSFIQIFIIQALLVFFISKLSPFKFIHAVLPACILAYVSGNRYTAYPALVETVENNMGADREVFTFVAGLGTALSFSGSAIAAGVSILFVAQAYGLDLSIYLRILIVFFITLATLKLDGIKDGSIVVLSIIMAQVLKLPAEGYALVLAIAGVIYQIESVTNITGTAAVSYIIANSEDAVSNVLVKDFI
ncbi:MAG TPA: dicarboxylate/amino acid:cation symporter [Spirochaetes bacterium]|nr:dicarboxylate/amino acid:cation symporter [Spirochaetota bacterium]